MTAALAAVFTLALDCTITSAATLESLQDGKTYRVGQIEISGNKAFSEVELLKQVHTKPRPFYLIWKKPPKFDRDVFATDVQRVRRFYQAHGYYSAVVSYDLQIKNNEVSAVIRVDEKKPVRVDRIEVQVDDYNVPQDRWPYGKLALKAGDIFTEDNYRNSQKKLRDFYRDDGYAHVTVQREALVNLAVHQVRVRYVIHPGISAVFGPTEVTGISKVDPAIVLRELNYKSGEPFSQSKLDKSRDRILKLDLFAVVRFDPQLKNPNPAVVPINLIVKEKPKHQIKIGGGYNTESQFVADFQWSDRNFMGNGRQVSILVQYSSINSTIAASLRQPYFLGIPDLTGVLELRQDVQQVPTYTLLASRFLPHVEYALSPHLTLTFGYRIEYAKLTAIDSTVVKALGGIRESGVLSGFDAAATWNTADDPYNPRHGNFLKLEAMEGGGVFGGNYDFYRADAEWKHYENLFWDTILATRLKVGTGDSLGPKIDYPLFDRFYAGGEGSVRGYAYWRLGPQSSDNVPLGGLSDVEGSIELRRKIWEQVGGALFLDFGQLSLHPYDLPVSSLKFAAGPAVSYMTPVGPIRIDLGIPFEKPRGEDQWQVYFSIGQFF
ncbi:MAG TPA: outer membrane protein assembly factor BamA [Candidatus Binataceae bacterium]|nr:outer membrane protein assembly factor BamA [Candidatus Binataceae bacterium]